MDLASSQSVVPSMTYLRNNESVQTEVGKHLVELRNLSESATKGRVKSQRGAPGDVFVKKISGLAITHHFNRYTQNSSNL